MKLKRSNPVLSWLIKFLIMIIETKSINFVNYDSLIFCHVFIKLSCYDYAPFLCNLICELNHETATTVLLRFWLRLFRSFFVVLTFDRARCTFLEILKNTKKIMITITDFGKIIDFNIF